MGTRIQGTLGDGRCLARVSNLTRNKEPNYVDVEVKPHRSCDGRPPPSQLPGPKGKKKHGSYLHVKIHGTMQRRVYLTDGDANYLVATRRGGPRKKETWTWRNMLRTRRVYLTDGTGLNPPRKPVSAHAPPPPKVTTSSMGTWHVMHSFGRTVPSASHSRALRAILPKGEGRGRGVACQPRIRDTRPPGWD